jgi:hypothetical protein
VNWPAQSTSNVSVDHGVDGTVSGSEIGPEQSEIAPTVVPDALLMKQGERLAIAHCPEEKHSHAAAPVAFGSVLGSTYPTQGPQAAATSPECWQVVTPSLHWPRLRFARRPGQHAAVWPGVSQGQPSRFLSSGQSGVPPGSGGGSVEQAGPQHMGGGSWAQYGSPPAPLLLELCPVVNMPEPAPPSDEPLPLPVPSPPVPNVEPPLLSAPPAQPCATANIPTTTASETMDSVFIGSA